MPLERLGLMSYFIHSPQTCKRNIELKNGNFYGPQFPPPAVWNYTTRQGLPIRVYPLIYRDWELKRSRTTFFFLFNFTILKKKYYTAFEDRWIGANQSTACGLTTPPCQNTCVFLSAAPYRTRPALLALGPDARSRWVNCGPAVALALGLP